MSATESRPTVMGEGIALGKRIQGYHFAHSPDGALCFEINEPADGMVTITSQQGDLNVKSGVIVVTRDLFEAAMRSYYVEFAAKKK